MKILITDSHIAIGEQTKEEEKAIIRRFTFKDFSKTMTRNGFDKRKIKSVSFVSKKKGFLLLRTGFIKDFLSFVKENNFTVSELVDKRTKFIKDIDLSDENLRKYFNKNFSYVDHQIRALRSMLKTNVGIIKAPTSSGKSSILKAYLKITGLRTIILVDGVSLATQLYNDLNEDGIDTGLVHGKSNTKGYNVVSTIGSYKKIGDLTEYQCVIVDEVHQAAANKFQEFFEKSNYPYRFGFSATPEGNDKFRFAKINQFLGSIIEEIYTKELIENEVMVKPKIKFIEVECRKTNSWESAQDKCIVNNKKRNKIITELANKQEEATLVLYKIIEHGEILSEEIENSVLLSGQNSNVEREQAIKDFKDGKIKVLIASNIFKQGISISNIKVLINASGGKSKIEVLQKIGRALRKFENKPYALVYDFMDIGNKFTNRHSVQRENLYKKVGFTDIEIVSKDNII